MNSLLTGISMTGTTIYLAKVTLILAVAWTVQLCLRRGNPRWRIFCWRSSLVALALVTVLSLHGPTFTLPLLPASYSASSPLRQAPTTNGAVAMSTADAPLGQPSLRDRAGRAPAQSTPAHDQQLANRVNWPTDRSATSAVLTTAVVESNDDLPAGTLVSWAVMIWLLGVCGGLARLCVGYLHIASICRHSAQAPQWLVAELVRVTGRSPALTIRQSESVRGPCSCGLIHTTVLLPPAMCRPERRTELRAILAHEAAHAAGHDLHWNCAWQLAAVMLWFHPLTWRISFAHADACDQRCDADAVHCLQDKQGYVRVLARIALQVTGPAPTCVLPMARGSNVTSRIHMIQRGVGRSRLPRWKTCFVAVAVAPLILWVGEAGMRPAIAQQNADQPSLDRIPTSDANKKQLAHQVDQMLSKWNEPGSPGCAIGIFRDGEILFSRGFGYAHLDYDIPISPQTVFETGYFSAAFTSACIALLMDQGKISPDDNIRQYVPELYDFNPPVRIRHLIRSRSGLWSLYSVMKLSGWDYVPIEYPLTKGDVLAIVAGQKSLPFEPGTQYRYGSTNYFLLALIVERVTGQTLAEFARQQIFEPLGMKRTSFLENPNVVIPGRAMGYHRDPWPDGEWHQWRSTNGFVFGPNAYTCVEDLYHWDQNFYENRLPRGKYMDQLITQGALLDNRDVLDIAGPTDHYRGLRRIQYYGGAYAFSCCLARFPDQKFTIVCLSNRQGMHPSRQAERIADIYLARHLEPMPTEHDASDSKKREFIELPAGELRTKVGAYRLQGNCNRVWQVSLTDGELFLTDHLNEKYPLKPVSNTQFHTQGAPRGFDRHPCVFQRTSRDQPSRLIIGEAEEAAIFDRVELANPSAVELRDYVGSYYSDELAAMYEFEVRDDALWLRVNNRGWERLDPTIRDTFIPHIRVAEDSRFINFHRNESMGVVGFDIDVPDMNDLYFTRRSDSSK